MTDWLVVIDMQPGFGHPDSPWCTPGYEVCAEKIGRMVDGYGEKVLFTRFVPPAEPVGAWQAYYEQWPFALSPEMRWVWELDPRWQDRPSVTSHRFSKWRELEAVLPGDARITLCGVATDCCVLGTAVEAVDAGRHLRLVADACAAGSQGLHEGAVAVMADRAPMLKITSTETVLSGE